MMIDTRASTDIVDKAAFQKMKQKQPIEDTCQVIAYGSRSQFSVLGKLDANI